MANTKTGLNFYTIDTDRYQDRRIKRIKKDFGCQGMAVYDYILCEIYRVQGCFLEWDENTAFDVAEYFGLKESVVSEIVRYCGAVGLFDKELLTRGVVTSASIQRRYLTMCERAKRRDVKIPEVCRIIPEESAIIPEVCPKTPEVCRQSKVKESKEKKIKRNTLSVSPSQDSGDTVEAPSDEPTESERENFFKIFFFKNFKNPAEQVERFVNHYKANGWTRNSGAKIVDRIALAQSWEVKDETQKNRFPHPFLQYWGKLYELAEKTGTPESALLLHDIQAVKDDDNAITMFISTQLMKYLQEYLYRAVLDFSAMYYPNKDLRTSIIKHTK